jgi:hypothetical protein
MSNPKETEIIDALIFVAAVLLVGLIGYLAVTELPDAIVAHVDTLAWMVVDR